MHNILKVVIHLSLNYHILYKSLCFLYSEYFIYPYHALIHESVDNLKRRSYLLVDEYVEYVYKCIK